MNKFYSDDPYFIKIQHVHIFLDFFVDFSWFPIKLITKFDDWP